tara:strand:+ start:82 stop:381 length:300 start_codon:yes stop_codon:yes gene_type:complete
MLSSVLGRLRLVALIEGIAYLVLLGIAMPLKYLYAMPLAVRVVGITHGLLFIVLVTLLLRAHEHHRWTTSFSIRVFVASLIPFGAFWMDRRLKRVEVVA